MQKEQKAVIESRLQQMRTQIRTLETYLESLKDNYNVLFEAWKIARDDKHQTASDENDAEIMRIYRAVKFEKIRTKADLKRCGCKNCLIALEYLNKKED
jgi:hypothetical protein